MWPKVKQIAQTVEVLAKLATAIALDVTERVIGHIAFDTASDRHREESGFLSISKMWSAEYRCMSVVKQT
jgi:hypothetical protein